MIDPIRILSNDEFQGLTLDEKLTYLHKLLTALLTADEYPARGGFQKGKTPNA